MKTRLLTPEEVRQKVDEGALLVDIRSADEYANGHIEHAQNITPEALVEEFGSPHQVIFYCRGGMRTQAQSDLIESKVGERGYILAGGLAAWRRSRRPIVVDNAHSLDVMRQVQLLAGVLVVISCILGAVVNAGFYWIAAFVGVGLLFAGVTGFCAMAKVLSHMPWNKPIQKGPA